MSYDSSTVYTGKVIDQSLGLGFQDKNQLSLVVKLAGKMRDRFRPKAGVEPLEKDDQIEVRVLFDNTNVDGLKKTFATLHAYGFDGFVINRFEPLHPENFSFVDKEVYCWAKEKTGKTGAIFYNWYLNAPPAGEKPADKGAMQEIAELMKATVADDGPGF